MGLAVITTLETTLVGVILDAGISLLSSALSKPKAAESPISYPRNEITRGGYLPLVLGRRQVGCNIGWVGDRVSHAAPHAGGSEIESAGPTGNLYYEGGWHQLCHGPARRLYRIWAGAKIVSSFLIDATTDSDGVLNQLPVLNGARDADFFRTFFGRDSLDDPSYQPVDAYLQKHSGLTSNYPGLMYVMWQRKALGGSPTWPLMKYEIEVRPEDIFAKTGLLDIFTPAGLPLWFDESTPAESIGGHNVIVWLNGKQSIAAGTYSITYVNGAFKLGISRGWQVFSSTGAIANFDIAVVDSAGTSHGDLPWINVGTNTFDTQVEAEAANAGATMSISWPGGIMGFRFRDFYYHPTCVNGLPNPTYNVSNGTQTYTASIAVQGGAAGSGDSGVMAAAALWILLCAPFPFGCALPTSCIDQTAILAVATQLTAERFAVNILAENGQDAGDVVGSLMSDIGMLLPQVGDKLVPYLIRTETTVPEITDSLRVGPLPEQQRGVGSLMGDRFTFEFSDVLNDWAISDITLDNDAQAFANNRPQATTLKLNNITNKFTAQATAYRRAPELSVQPQKVSEFTTLRETRNPNFHPGRSFIMDGTQYRLTSWKPDTVGVSAEIGAVLDQYGDTSITYDQSGDGYNSSAPPAEFPQPDIFFAPMVIPRSEWSSDTSPLFGVPRVRENDAVSGAAVWISNASAGTYNAIASQDAPSAGGLLLAAFDSSPGVIASGPAFNPYNDDILNVPDLTGDATDYANGELTLQCESEIMLLESITANIDGSYTPNNLTRGAFNTPISNHSAGTPVVIVVRDDLFGIYSPLLGSVSPAGGTLWIKTQPTDGTNVVDLSIVTPEPLVVPPNLLATITVYSIVGPIFIGSTLPIQWATTNLTGTLDVSVSYDGGATFTSLATGLADTGSYIWDTTGATPSTTTVIRVSSTLTPQVYADTYPFDLIGDSVVPAFNVSGAPITYFGGGKYYPPRIYTITYLGGAINYTGDPTTFNINGNFTTNCYQVVYNNGAATATAPGDDVNYPSLTALQAANAGASITINHTGGTIGVCLQDSPNWTDNIPAPPAVSYGLS